MTLTRIFLLAILGIVTVVVISAFLADAKTQDFAQITGLAS